MFEGFELDIEPKQKLDKTETNGMRKVLARVDLWAFGRGFSLNHVNLPDHIAFEGPNEIYTSVDSDGELVIRTENVDRDNMRTIEKIVSNILRLVSETAKRNTVYDGTVFFHSNVKDKNLKRLIQASLQSSMNPFFVERFGKSVTTDAIALKLTTDLSILMTSPDDIDFFVDVELSPKNMTAGFLQTHLSQLQSRIEELK